MECKFYDGQYIRGRVPFEKSSAIPSVFDYIEYEFTQQSIWELFLLSISWRFMPLHWHANYAQTDYIFERKDIEELVSSRVIYNKKRHSLTPQPAMYINDDTLLPEVKIVSECEAEIRISYGNSWAGLVREIISVERRNGTTTFTKKSRETLIKFNIGILF